MHMDTPYYDPVNKQISKYTIIIYISGGTGTPALHIGGGEEGEKEEVKKGGKGGKGVSLEKIEEMQCVVFDQKYEHEGSAYVAGNKVCYLYLIFPKCNTIP
jgi:hypothetical protein